MRNDLMDFLLEHANHIAGGLMSYEALAMLNALDIEREVRLKISRNACISTLEDYAHWMRIATPNRCLFGNTPELHLIAKMYCLECCSILSQSPQSSRVHFKGTHNGGSKQL